MIKTFILTILLASTVSLSSEDNISFNCKEAYIAKFNKTMAFTMIKLDSLETAKGSIYEAIMGEDYYRNSMEKTYNAILEENKNDPVFERRFDFKNFESPIHEITRKLNRGKNSSNTTYSQVAKIILDNSQNDLFCPNGNPVSLKGMIKIIKSEL